jgi:hypothetical protein
MNCMNGWLAIWFVASGWRSVIMFTYGSWDDVAFVIRVYQIKVFARIDSCSCFVGSIYPIEIAAKPIKILGPTDDRWANCWVSYEICKSKNHLLFPIGLGKPITTVRTTAKPTPERNKREQSKK